MMAKVKKGNSAAACVDYVTRKKKDSEDGTPCNEWKIIGNSAFLEGANREEIIASLEDNISLRPKIKNHVGHISLNFHENDKDKITDSVMLEIAGKYMERMSIVDTPFIIVRHFDKPYHHCHLVFSRVNNHAEVISDSNDQYRNRDVCLALTQEYGLYISDGKQHTNVEQLRGAEKIRYEIFNAVQSVWNDSSVSTFDQFESRLSSLGVSIEKKYRRGTDQVEGLWYVRKGTKFPASKIDRRFSFGNITKHLEKNKPLHPQSKWLYADGSIVPVTKAFGVKLNNEQQNEYVKGNAVRLDGCTGDYPTLWIRFNPHTLKPTWYSTNPNETKKQSATPPLVTISTPTIAPSPVDDSPAPQLSSGGSGHESFKEFWKNHPELSYQAALRQYRAKYPKHGIGL